MIQNKRLSFLLSPPPPFPQPLLKVVTKHLQYLWDKNYLHFEFSSTEVTGIVSRKLLLHC